MTKTLAYLLAQLSLLVIFSLPAMAVSPEEYKNEFGFPGETATYDTAYFDGSMLYVFYYCNPNCVTIIFDPESIRPFFDQSKLTEISKNIETQQYIKSRGINPDTYNAALSDLGVQRSVVCKPLDYVDAVQDTAVLQAEKVAISYVPRDSKQEALFIASLFNKAADVKKYNLPVVILGIACWGEDITLNEFAKSAKTSGDIASNINNKVFVTGQTDTLFSSHERFILTLQARKYTFGTAGSSIWTFLVNAFGGNEKSALDKINEWDNKTSAYFKSEDKVRINSNAQQNAQSSIDRLTSLDNEITSGIATLSSQINEERKNRKGNNLLKPLLFDYNYTTVDGKLNEAGTQITQAEASKSVYKYNTARQQLGAGSVALSGAITEKQQVEGVWPTWWKLLLGLLLIAGVYRYIDERAGIGLGIGLIIIIIL